MKKLWSRITKFFKSRVEYFISDDGMKGYTDLEEHYLNQAVDRKDLESRMKMLQRFRYRGMWL